MPATWLTTQGLRRFLSRGSSESTAITPGDHMTEHDFIRGVWNQIFEQVSAYGAFRMPHFVATSIARLAPSHLEPDQSPLVHMAVPFLDSMA